ncbi:TPA_asm: hypothetical protein 3 [Manila clam xenomavirus]|nr:TPA_asm: hypothetical protein 3 [Manila clam xenomavirus]
MTTKETFDQIMAYAPVNPGLFALTNKEKDRVETKSIMKNVLNSMFPRNRTDQVTMARLVKGGYFKDKKTLEDLKRKVEFERIMDLDEKQFRSQLTGQQYYIDSNRGKIRIVDPESFDIIESEDIPLANNPGFFTLTREVPWVDGYFRSFVIELPDIMFWMKKYNKEKIKDFEPCWELVSFTDYGESIKSNDQTLYEIFVIGPSKLALAKQQDVRKKLENAQEVAVYGGGDIAKFDLSPQVLVWNALEDPAKYSNITYDPIGGSGFGLYKPNRGCWAREICMEKAKFQNEIDNNGRNFSETSRGHTVSVIDNELGRGIQCPFHRICIWTAKKQESARFPNARVAVKQIDFNFIMSYRKKIDIDIDDSLKAWAEDIVDENAPILTNETWLGPNRPMPDSLNKIVDIINVIPADTRVSHRDDRLTQEAVTDTVSQTTQGHADTTNLDPFHSGHTDELYNPFSAANNRFDSSRTVTDKVVKETIFDPVPANLGQNYLTVKNVPPELNNIDNYQDSTNFPQAWHHHRVRRSLSAPLTALPKEVGAFGHFLRRNTGGEIHDTIFQSDACNLTINTHFDEAHTRLKAAITHAVSMSEDHVNILHSVVQPQARSFKRYFSQDKPEGQEILFNPKFVEFASSPLGTSTFLLGYSSDGVPETLMKTFDKLTFDKVTVDGKVIKVFPRPSLLFRESFGKSKLDSTFEALVQDLSCWIEFWAYFLAQKTITMPGYAELVNNEWEGSRVMPENILAAEDVISDTHPREGWCSDEPASEKLLDFQPASAGYVDTLLAYTVVLTMLVNITLVDVYLNKLSGKNRSMVNERITSDVYKTVTENTSCLKWWGCYVRWLYNHELFSKYGGSLAKHKKNGGTHDYPNCGLATSSLEDSTKHEYDYVYHPGGYLLQRIGYVCEDDGGNTCNPYSVTSSWISGVLSGGDEVQQTLYKMGVSGTDLVPKFMSVFAGKDNNVCYRGVEILFPTFKHPLDKTDVGRQLNTIDAIFHGSPTMERLIEDNERTSLSFHQGVTKVYDFSDRQLGRNVYELTPTGKFSKGANFFTNLSDPIGHQVEFITQLQQEFDYLRVMRLIPGYNSHVLVHVNNAGDEKRKFGYGTYIRKSCFDYDNALANEERGTKYLADKYISTKGVVLENPVETEGTWPLCCDVYNWFFGQEISADNKFSNLSAVLFNQIENVTELTDKDHTIFKAQYKNSFDLLATLESDGVIKRVNEVNEPFNILWNVPRAKTRAWFSDHTKKFVNQMTNEPTEIPAQTDITKFGYSVGKGTRNAVAVCDFIENIVPINSKLRKTDFSGQHDLELLKELEFLKCKIADSDQFVSFQTA